MRCYYEVLEVKQDASDEELRKSYRRLALQLHPDKNPENAEEAKAKFQEIQGAYEVLSDPQERAFYDRNRESILHGEEFGSGPKEDSLHLYKYFNASCYSGFSDSDTGFYTVYRRVFDTIAAKDLRYMDDEEEVSIPTFGKSDTNLEDVAEFYGYWQSYCTAMSFYWVDKYDVRHAPNRWVEKRVERENKKVRDKAKKEYNEEIRSLVSFARKRDKRWDARKKQLEEKVAANARKQTELQRQQREERLKWMEETFEEQKESLSQYERQLKEMESQFAEEWGKSESSDEADDDSDSDFVAAEESDGLYCIACQKLFKSDKAFTNHEKSRKHQEKTAALSALMKEEDAAFAATSKGGGGDLSNGGGGGPHDDEPASEEEILVTSSKKNKKKKKRQTQDVAPALESRSKQRLSRRNKQALERNIFDQDSSEEEEEEKEPEGVMEDAIPAASQNGTAAEETGSGLSSAASHSDEGNARATQQTDAKKKKTREKVPTSKELKAGKKISKKSKKFPEDMANLRLEEEEEEEEEDDDDDEEEEEEEEEEERKGVDSPRSGVRTNDEGADLEGESDEEEESQGVKVKLKGKKAKEAKKKLRKQLSSAQQVENICTVCKGKFDSKNKLFTHLKSSGHAAIKTTKSKR